MHVLLDLSRKLADGALTSRALVEQSLDRISNPDGEGARAFLSVYDERARDEAGRVDEARAKGWAIPRFSGIPISIKDLFDVAGEVTRAGSHVLDEQPPAASDAPAVENLRRAGFIILGKTNMTEFAYSGLGMNAHFGTPRSPYERNVGRIAGGSTSGGAVSVADGMAAATIGTDTGGSCRIPAAFCGITGFKPTSERVSRAGAVPLSKSLDAIGPLANSVSCCAVLDSILTGGGGQDEEPFPAAGLRLGVLEGYVMEHVDADVAASYQAALTRLSKAGASLTDVAIGELAELPEINAKGGIVGAEAYAWHRHFLNSRRDHYDPWVRARCEAGEAQSAADYIDLLDHRTRIIDAVRGQTGMFDALVLPTVQIIPPAIEALGDADFSNATNLLCLRNTALGNFLDRAAISIPCHAPGSPPVGLMLMGDSGHDRHLLSIARGLEDVVRVR